MVTRASTKTTTPQPSLALLPLKLVPPAKRSGVVLRPDLQALLAEVRLQPLTVVAAPAGYGKTTLLCHWADDLARTGAHVCWVALDEGDQSPALLLAYLVRAFQTKFPNVGDQAWRLLHSAANLERDWPIVAGALFSELQEHLSTPTFLILDDFHVIADGPISAILLGYLLRVAPPALHIIASSRRPLNMPPLSRLRTEGTIVEVLQHDLSLTAAEARVLLEQSDVQLQDDELALLLDRTEGWALSVQLAARALARYTPKQRRAYLQTLDTNQQSLFDYLATEVLIDLPDDLIGMLTLAALTDQFDAPLLAQVLEQPQAAQSIERTQQLGLPITPIDDSSNQSYPTYRLHPLWRKLLLDRAHAQHSTAELHRLHHRYGQAFEQRGNLEAALTHYAATNDVDELARALREHAWPLINTPQRETIRHWLERLPETQRSDDPELLHMWGWSLAMLAPSRAVAAISEAAAIYSSRGLYQREIRALSDLASLLFWEDRPSDFAAVCIRAIRAANRVRDAWARGTALVSVVAMLYSRGRFDAALRVANQAATHPRNTFWQWLLALIVSAIHIQQGHPNAALHTLEAALVVPQIDRDNRLRQNLISQQAMALYQQGQLAEATELALDVDRHLSDYYDDGMVGTNAAFLTLLLTEQERFEEATIRLNRARSIANRVGTIALLARVQMLESYALLRTNRVAQGVAIALDVSRQTRASQIDNVPERSPLLREQIPSLVEAFSLLNAQELWLQLLPLMVLGEGGETQRAIVLADELIEHMQQRNDGLFLVVARLYRAALAQYVGDTTTQITLLHTGWQQAEQEGYTFLPLLPERALYAAVEYALRNQLAPETIIAVLEHQLPNRATALLIDLLKSETAAETQVYFADLLGRLGAAEAFPTLRGLVKSREPKVKAAAEQALRQLVYRPSYTLKIWTLGAFSVWRGDTEIRDRDWRSVKARQLLQLLIVERGRMLPRDRIMDMLWPGLDSEAAANNLRVTLSRLTKAIETQRPEGAPTYYVMQQGETYGFGVKSDYELDANNFANAVIQGRHAQQTGQREAAITNYRDAINLYGGPFLPDCLYEDWSVVERERLSLLFTEASLRLGELLLEDNEAHESIGLAWRVLEQDQAQEEAYRLLMQAYAKLGERSTAIRLYTRCVSALETELGVEPMPETVALYNELRSNDANDVL